MDVVEGDRSIALGGAKQRALLAVLRLHANEVVSSDRLIAELWGERPPATAAKSVQTYVSRLRKQLGERRLATHAPGYVLYVESTDRDLGRFEVLVAEARRAPPAAAAAGSCAARLGSGAARRSRTWRTMLALYRSGRQAEALHACRAARRELAEELGLEPGGELRRLERRDPHPRRQRSSRLRPRRRRRHPRAGRPAARCWSPRRSSTRSTRC